VLATLPIGGIIAASYDDLIQTHAMPRIGVDLIAGAVEFRAAVDGRTSVSVGARFCLNCDDDDVAGMLGRGQRLELEERGARRAEGRQSWNRTSDCGCWNPKREKILDLSEIRIELRKQLNCPRDPSSGEEGESESERAASNVALLPCFGLV
jgi:hypothetical protein